MSDASTYRDDAHFIEAVIEEARRALASGNSPFAAAVIKDGRLLSLVGNKTAASGSEIDHAEVVALREAYETASPADVQNSILYCSCEPCIMCLSTAFYAGVSRVVYAAPIGEAISRGSGDPNVKASDLVAFARLPITVEEYPHLGIAVSKLFDAAIKQRGKL